MRNIQKERVLKAFGIACVVLQLAYVNCGLKKEAVAPLRFDDGVDLPKPEFDKSLKDLLHEFNQKYNAEGVRIGRPFVYTNQGDTTYWLKIEFLNPTLNNVPFKKIGNNIALELYEHLENKKKFEKIEVAIRSTRGFILTFATNRSDFFYRDSLLRNP